MTSSMQIANKDTHVRSLRLSRAENEITSSTIDACNTDILIYEEENSFSMINENG